MTEREALKLALECAERCESIDGMYSWTDTITAIKEALAQPAQEPVAWVEGDEPILTWVKTDPKAIPLYTTPPQRTWVGLTPEEVEACIHHVDEAGIGLFDFAEAIEAKLKEKNT